MKTQAKCKINLNDHIFSYAMVLNILSNDNDDEISLIPSVYLIRVNEGN